MSLSGSLLDLLFPPRCAFCGGLLDCSGEGVCPDCSRDLPFVEEGRVLRDAGDFPCAVSLYYDGMVKEGVRALKFQKKAWRAEVFGRLIAQTAAEHLAGRFDAVTFVPVSWRRNFTRGFDQGRLLAHWAAASWGMEEERTLRKIRHNQPQSSLEDPELRRKNVKNAYAVPDPARVVGRRFLLIDDVSTTGSTLSACGEALVRAGAASVVCAALAGGHREASA